MNYKSVQQKPAKQQSISDNQSDNFMGSYIKTSKVSVITNLSWSGAPSAKQLGLNFLMATSHPFHFPWNTDPYVPDPSSLIYSRSEFFIVCRKQQKDSSQYKNNKKIQSRAKRSTSAQIQFKAELFIVENYLQKVTRDASVSLGAITIFSNVSLLENSH